MTHCRNEQVIVAQLMVTHAEGCPPAGKNSKSHPSQRKVSLNKPCTPSSSLDSPRGGGGGGGLLARGGGVYQIRSVLIVLIKGKRC